MANQSLAKVQPIDPEFAAVYAESASVPRRSEPKADSSNPEEPEDSLLTLKAIAERNAQNARKRSECQPGFDEVENDLSNVCKTVFDFVTRPL